MRRNYLIETDFDQYALKPGFDTQRKIYDHFTPQGLTREVHDQDVIIRDGLMSLLNEVLFIKDPYSHYPAWHPRIAFHFTYSYRDLEDYKKNALNDLYIHFFYKNTKNSGNTMPWPSCLPSFPPQICSFVARTWAWSPTTCLR